MSETTTLTHQDSDGRVKMVDVGQKQSTARMALAFASMFAGEKVLELLQAGGLAKGDAWAASRVAAIMAAKKTSELIPLTHPIRLDSVRVDLFAIGKDRIGCFATASAFDRTGVEMEAMVAASTAMLNMYDMVKGANKGACIEQTRLVYKSGGKSGDWLSPSAQIGQIEKLATSKGKGTPKDPCDEAMLKVRFGIENDAHGGDWHRQVSLLGVESIEKMRSKGLEVDFGSFAENIATSGICLYELPVGTLMWCEAGPVMQVTQIGKECHTKCAVYYRAGDCVMPREGIFTIVLAGGQIKSGERFITLQM
ncbi:MAG: cyclic pyranopterin monophosphate synthase MoaC [Candidatus Riflebacteria bacterium]|nr:cyclic pyranopterin monophosphate synthase MoaC [Candidatus Riflebacteria bacterium]